MFINTSHTLIDPIKNLHYETNDKCIFMLYSMVKMKSSSDNIIENDRKSILHKNTENNLERKKKLCLRIPTLYICHIHIAYSHYFLVVRVYFHMAKMRLSVFRKRDDFSEIK